MSRFSFELLTKQNRSEFNCDVEALDRYFHKQVSQDIKRRITACYIAVERETGIIAGFYTLSAADIAINDVDSELIRKLPRYPTLPAARLGRLAIDLRYRGIKLGSALLADAVLRTDATDIGVFAMIVEAKDEQAEAFYRYHGFDIYGSVPGKLIAPLKALLP